jgi:hypothetical protein
MSCDEIKVNDKINEITITNNEDSFDVVDSEIVTTVTNNEDSFEVTDEVGEEITINLTDVRLIPPQDVDVNMNCTATEQVGNAVYVFADGEVRQANNTNIATAKVIGFIVTKPTTTSCTVRVIGIIDFFTGLTPGKHYFLDDVNGDIDLTAPTTSNSVVTRVGQAIGTDKFLINISNNRLVRS